jgi:glycosyltransferase involved in cell wall biosynthesis
VERFDLSGCDLVLSSSHSVAKGARAPDNVPHLCYCHTPMRYVWDQHDAYFAPGRAAVGVRAAMSLVSKRLRRWDVASAARVSSFIANSENVRERIRRCYDRDATVVYPPVAIDRFTPAATRDDYYVIVSALVPYKRIDLAVAAFNKLGRRLLVVGEGPELPKLQNSADANVVFLGHLPDDEVAEILGRARAFVVPGEEDFGIAPVEAQAAGTPVIAFRRGGVLETVIDAEAEAGANGTGVFFDQSTVEALADTVVRFEKLDFSARVIRANAERFDGTSFARGMRRLLTQQQTAAA